MMVIPYDIWLHITSYLTPAEIWDLRYLNHALFDIALDSHYRTVEVSMTFPEQERYIPNFVRFRDPNIAKRVRELSYHPNALTKFPRRKSIKTTPSSIKRRLKSFFAKPSFTQTDMINTLESFTNLISIEVRCLIFDPVPDCAPLIHTNFRTCYSQLQSLVFNVHLAHIPILILPDLLLPSLTSLSIIFFGCTPATAFEDVARTTVVPFINRHKDTITSLDFKMLAGEILDMAYLFQGITHISSLKTIFTCFAPSTQPQSISRFLDMHCATLQDVTIGLMERSYQLLDRIFQDVQGEFPNLYKFSVVCWGCRYIPFMGSNLGPTLDFIKCCSSSLVSFDIMGGAQSSDRLQQFLVPQGRQDTHFVNLRSLHMALQVLTPEIMDLFASQLPNLQSLDLYVVTLRSRANMPSEVVDQYELSVMMGSRCYSSWHLEHLVLLVQHTDLLTWSTSNINPIVFPRAIPSLKTFNGRNIADYPPTRLEVALVQ